MKFLFILFIFGSFFANASRDFFVRQENPALKQYNQGVKFYNSQEKVKAIASFRKALQSDPWLWPAKKALDQLQHPPPFYLLIPSEIFLFLIAIGLVGLCFSLSAGRLIFFGLCLILHFGFSFYQGRPHLTILEETQAHTAPHASSPVLFSLAPGEWVIQRKTEKEWIQIKTSEQTIGWILKAQPQNIQE